MQGDDNVEYFLALAPSGIIVLRNRSKVGNYYWPRIVKVYRKGKHFMTRVVEKTNDEHTYGFRLPSKEACKHLWQCCTEHQAFFKLSQDKESLMKRGSLSTIAHRFRNSIRRSSLTRGANGQVNLAHDRAPPTVVRVPSRRYQRRMGQPDGADALNGHAVGKDESYKENGYIEVRSSIVVPAGRHVTQPVIYRTSSVPGPLNEPSKTSPWDNPRQRGLFSSSTNASPRSVRSAYMARPQHERCDVDNNANHVNQRRNSSSSHHRHRQSDVESQVSKCSKSSHRSHRSSRSSSSHHRCRRRHENESGTESDSSRKRHRRRHRCCEKTGSTHKLVDSEQQWLEIQRRQLEQQAAGQFDGPRAGVAVVRELAPTGRHISGYGSGHESESEVNGSSSLSRAKRRTKALSENGRSRDIIMPREVKKHIQYDLVEPTEIDKNDIRYTKVETESRLFKIRYSPKTGRARGKLTNDIKQNSAGSTDSKSNEEDSVAQFTPPPNMIYTRNGNYNGSAFNQDSNETASCSNSTASVGHNESSPSGNMFRPVKPNDWSAQISQAYGTLNAQRQYRKTSSDDSDLLDDTSGQRSRKPFIDNHYTNMLNYESGYGSGSTPRVVTFQSPPSTTAYYSSDVSNMKSDVQFV
ncbi:Band 4.1-like protein 4A [Halotydeus destructor]|nr:Band 4.1-like protein 4A [Halotydeus destructor]